MVKQVVEILVKKDGSFTLEAKEGFSGESCMKQTKQLEIMLGGEPVSQEKTSSYYDDDGNDMNLNLDI